jgi:hypothetical protein
MIWRSSILFALSAATALLCHSSHSARGGDDVGVITELPLVAGIYVLPVELPTGQQLYVRDLSLERLDQRSADRRVLKAHYIYWFVGKDVTTTSDAKRQWLSFSDSVFRQVNHRWAYPSVMAFVTQGMNPQQSGQRERNDTQTVGMLLDLVRTLAPKFQKNLMP